MGASPCLEDSLKGANIPQLSLPFGIGHLLTQIRTKDSCKESLLSIREANIVWQQTHKTRHKWKTSTPASTWERKDFRETKGSESGPDGCRLKGMCAVSEERDWWEREERGWKPEPSVWFWYVHCLCCWTGKNEEYVFKRKMQVYISEARVWLDLRIQHDDKA